MVVSFERRDIGSESTALLRTEIRRKTQQSRDNRLLYRMVCMLMLGEGHSAQQVANWFGEHPRTLDRWRKRFEENGVAGLRDESSPGRPPRLSNEQLNELKTDLRLPPYTLGYSANSWRGKVLQAHIERRYGVEISLRHCQRLMKKMKAENQTADDQTQASEEASDLTTEA